MDTGTLIALLTSLGAGFGGFWSGRQVSQVAAQTVDMLKSQIEELRLRCEQIPMLQDRIVILEEMVTQRARVEEVFEIVTAIKEQLDARP